MAIRKAQRVSPSQGLSGETGLNAAAIASDISHAAKVTSTSGDAHEAPANVESQSVMASAATIVQTTQSASLRAARGQGTPTAAQIANRVQGSAPL